MAMDLDTGKYGFVNVAQEGIAKNKAGEKYIYETESWCSKTFSALEMG